MPKGASSAISAAKSALMSRNPEAVGRSIYDDPVAYAAVYGAPTQNSAPAWDASVLQDMRHPLFAEHKRRFELWQDAQDDDW